MRLPLPDFASPPVVEVLLGVQFDSVDGLNSPRLGLLWSTFRDRFPRVEERPPLDPIVEQPSGPSYPLVQLRLEALNRFPSPRLWFLNESGTELIQVQHDRFVHNWRKIGEADSYPRYERIRQTFMEELERFREFINAEKLDQLSPNLCEVTYINHILVGREINELGELGEAVTLWRHDRTRDLPNPEDVRFQARYPLTSNTNTLGGRLTIEAAPAYRNTDRAAMIVLTLTARGAPQGDNAKSIAEFMDMGREAIVRTFTAITTERMHRIWRRQDGSNSA